jgi:hypothetical protein
MIKGKPIPLSQVANSFCIFINESDKRKWNMYNFMCIYVHLLSHYQIIISLNSYSLLVPNNLYYLAMVTSRCKNVIWSPGFVIAYESFIPVPVGILKLSLLKDFVVSLKPCWMQEGAHIPTLFKLSVKFLRINKEAVL